MQRDWDVIRKILLTCEAAPAGQPVQENAFPGVDRAILFEHVKMLNDIGYIDARLMHIIGPEVGGFVIMGLRWDGHDLLAKMRSKMWWERLKAIAAEKGLDLTWDVIKALALPAAKSVLGMPE